MILVLWAMPVFVDIHNCRMQVPGTFSYQRERDATLQAHHCSDDIFLLVTVTYYPVYRYVIMLYKSTHWFSMSLFCTYIIQYISSHCIASYLLPLVTWHDIVYHYVNYHSWAYIASHHITSHCTDIVTCYFSLLLPLSLYMHMFTHSHTSHLHPYPSACDTNCKSPGSSPAAIDDLRSSLSAAFASPSLLNASFCFPGLYKPRLDAGGLLNVSGLADGPWFVNVKPT